jgi:hypothetical protein
MIAEKFVAIVNTKKNKKKKKGGGDLHVSGNTTY